MLVITPTSAEKNSDNGFASYEVAVLAKGVTSNAITNVDLLTDINDLLKNQSFMTKVGGKTGLIDLVKDAPSSIVKSIKQNTDLFDSWKVLKLAGSKYVKTDAVYLKKFSNLSSNNQALIAQFTDAAAGSTLTKFLDDCDNASFLTYVNSADNSLEVRGFLAHKAGMITDAENQDIAEMLELDEFENPLVKKWLEYGDNMAVFKANRTAGNVFGDLMKIQLGDVNSEAYKAMKQQFSLAGKNLDDYSIYSQLQFCLNTNCLKKGEFWIPDFVAVIEKTDLNGTYLETIIIDSKLSKSTDWTVNQKVAKGMSSWNIKTNPSASSIIKGNNIASFKQNVNVVKDGTFIKLFSENGVINTTR